MLKRGGRGVELWGAVSSIGDEWSYAIGRRWWYVIVKFFSLGILLNSAGDGIGRLMYVDGGQTPRCASPLPLILLFPHAQRTTHTLRNTVSSLRFT